MITKLFLLHGMYVCIIRVHQKSRIKGRFYIYIFIYIYICMYVFVCIHIHMYVFVCVCIYTCIRRFIMEISLSHYGCWYVHDLLSSSWRTRKVTGIIKPEFQDLRLGATSLCPGVWKPENLYKRIKCGHPSSRKEREFTFIIHFCSTRALQQVGYWPHWGG